MSSTLGSVAAVSDTESPSQLSPALIHSRWTVMSDGFVGVGPGISPPVVRRTACTYVESGGTDKKETCPPTRPRITAELIWHQYILRRGSDSSHQLSGRPTSDFRSAA